jgi:hypothetical protein
MYQTRSIHDVIIQSQLAQLLLCLANELLYFDKRSELAGCVIDAAAWFVLSARSVGGVYYTAC